MLKQMQDSCTTNHYANQSIKNVLSMILNSCLP